MDEGVESDDRSLPYLRLPSESVDLCRRLLSRSPNLAKPLLLLARFGSLPANEDSSLAKRVSPAIRAILGEALGYTTTSLLSYQEITDKLHSKLPDLFDPVIRGCVVQMCETYRLPKEEEDALRSWSLQKEISVFRSVVSYRPELNWDALWDGGQLVPGKDMTPWTSADIGFATQASLDSYKRRIFYPSMSRKLLTTRAREWLRERPHHTFEDSEIATPAELERLYVVYGVECMGPCQISQRWYFHGLVPRTYAVAGETAYTFSKYLKEIWDILWNAFPPTQKFNRVNISRIRRSSMKYSFAVYDLTTFTSNLETHRDFVLALSRHMDIEVTLADGRRGFRRHSLKTLLEEYASYLCRDVRWYTDLEEFSYIPEEVHAVAGLLGVIGNIASCGIAHGMFLRTLVNRLEEEGVAGDDAIFVYLVKQGWRNTTDTINGNLGLLAEEKVYDLAEEDGVYLKRGIEITSSGNLSLHNYVFFPKLFFLSPNDLDRYRESVDAQYDDHALKRLFVSSLGSTFRSAGDIAFDPTLLKNLLTEVYDRLELPYTGHCPGIAREHTMPVWAEDLFVPGIDRLGDPEYVRRQYYDFFDGGGTFPETELDHDPVSFEVTPGSVFRAKGSRAVSYLVRLGVLRREKVLIGLSGFMAVERLATMTEKRRTPHVYEYSVVDPVLLSFVHSDLRVVRGCPITG